MSVCGIFSVTSLMASLRWSKAGATPLSDVGESVSTGRQLAARPASLQTFEIAAHRPCKHVAYSDDA